MDVLCAWLLDFLVQALLVPPQVSDLAESLPAILADVFLHVGMNRIRVCLGALYFSSKHDFNFSTYLLRFPKHLNTY